MKKEIVEALKKLPQLDRIEARQRLRYVEEDRDNALDYFTRSSRSWIFGAIGMTMFSLLLWYTNAEAGLAWLKLSVLILKLCIIMLVINFIGAVWDIIKSSKDRDKIINEYITISPRPSESQKPIILFSNGKNKKGGGK